MNFNWSILYILQVFTQSHKQTSKTMIPLFFTCFSSHEVRINEKYYSHFSLIKNFWQPSDNFTHKYSSKRQNQNIFNHSQREFNYVKTVMTLSCRVRNGDFWNIPEWFKGPSMRGRMGLCLYATFWGKPFYLQVLV